MPHEGAAAAAASKLIRASSAGRIRSTRTCPVGGWRWGWGVRIPQLRWVLQHHIALLGLLLSGPLPGQAATRSAIYLRSSIPHAEVPVAEMTGGSMEFCAMTMRLG